MTEDNGRPAGRVPHYFRSRQPVRWLAPQEIARGAYGAFFGGLFSRYVDSRERIALLRPAVVHCRETARSRASELAVDPPPWTGGDGRPDHDHDDSHDSRESTLIVDYLADSGDGFGPTYAVAELANSPITVDDEKGEPRVLPIGRALILGGDQVYPVANARTYRDRFVGPYCLAADEAGREQSTHRPYFAIPGNHDWYDGLASFLNVFTVPVAGERSGPGGRWCRHQTRSYFALELDHGWWAWAVDAGLDPSVGISQSQLDYFSSAAALLEPDDRIILCVPEPVWLKRSSFEVNREPDGWDRLVECLHAVLGDDAWRRVRVVLTGDKHYYAHHRATGDHDTCLMTAGGGGAFLSSSVDAHRSVTLNFEPLDAASGQSGVEVERQRTWPTVDTSRRFGRWGLWRIPLTNPTFNALLSAIYGLFAFFSVTGWRRPSFAASRTLGSTLDRMAAGPLYLAVRDALLGAAVSFGGFVYTLIVLAGLAALAATAWQQARWRGLLLAGGHGVAQILGLGATMVVASKIAWDSTADVALWNLVLALLLIAFAIMAIPVAWNGVIYEVWTVWQLALFFPTMVVLLLLFAAGVSNAETGAITVILAAAMLGGLVGPFLFACYLVLGQRFLVGLNELFVGIRHTGYKHFVRIEISRDVVTLNVIGVRRTIPRSARLTADGKVAMSRPIWERMPGLPLVDRLRPTEPELVDQVVVGRDPI